MLYGMDQIFENSENYHWLNCVVIYKNSLLTNKDELYSIAESDIFKRGNDNCHIVSVHECGSSSHLHWIHGCTTYNLRRGCNCIAVRLLRSKGMRIKFIDFDGKATPKVNSLMAYLSKQGRNTVSCFQRGTKRLGQYRSIVDNYQAKDDGSNNDYTGCFFDDPQERSIPSRNHQTTGKGMQKRSQAYTAVDWEQEASKIYLIVQKNKYSSTSGAFNDTEFISKFSSIYYNQYPKLRTVTDNVLNQVMREWKFTSFGEIMLKNINTVWDDVLYYDTDYSAHILMKLLFAQYQTVSRVNMFLNQILAVLDCQIPKVNTINIIGPPGSGKTYFVECIAKQCWFVGRCESSINKFSSFPFEHLMNKRMGIFNEFNCSPSFVDIMKEIFEGSSTAVNIKYLQKTVLERTPIFITTNNRWVEDHHHHARVAFEQRMFSHNWQSQPWLKNLDGYPHPNCLSKLFYKTDDQLTKLLEPIEPSYIVSQNIIQYLSMEDFNKSYK